ncbi:lysophospholipid acyltransferase family protein [Aestuariimicrobium soli]|uniref:lysophospholipid acyltransferase family protein n=1 Tax=Aestuariimicrobium soli TaxID=2035834 RepID=UPI003EC02804
MPSSNASSFRAVKRVAGRVVHRALTLVGAPAVAEFRHLEVEGLDNVPATGAALIACNHRSTLDTAIVQAALDRTARVVSVENAWPGHGEDEAERLADLVAQGELLLTFPEGQPSPDGLVHRGHIGLGAVVLTHQLPVIPAALVDHGRSVRFGTRVTFERHAGLPVTRTLARAVTDEVMEAVLQVSGHDYDDSTSAGARSQARRERREQITARRVSAAARRRAVKVAEVARRNQRELERADLARRAEEAEIVARRHAEDAARRDREHHHDGTSRER